MSSSQDPAADIAVEADSLSMPNLSSMPMAIVGGIDIEEIVRRLVKYLLEGFAVAIAAYYIPKRKMDLKEIATIAVTAASVFAVLDLASPSIASSARMGAGFGIGMARVA